MSAPKPATKGKKIPEGQLRISIHGGKANPAPPVGSALGPKGINIMEFCKQFNARTADTPGVPVTVVISYYKDKSFDFILKQPNASYLVKQAASIESGSSEPGKNIVASVTEAQLIEIAKKKIMDMNAISIDGAVKILAGTARSMGINVIWNSSN